MWLRSLEIRDLRNIRQAELEFDSGVNVLFGANAQGKTSVLEAIGLLARGRSFRTEQARELIRRGATSLRAAGTVVEQDLSARLEVGVDGEGRRLALNGRSIRPVDYYGQFEVGVYSTDRLVAVRGSMRDRRLFVDRMAAATWPSYRRLLREYERILRQRTAALEDGRNGIEAWDERLIDVGADLRARRQGYVGILGDKLGELSLIENEQYQIHVSDSVDGEQAHRLQLERQLREVRDRERRSGRTLAGPHRDRIGLLIDGQEVGEGASSGQSRSLLLALTMASLDVYREVRGRRPVALLDDLDSELDEQRAMRLCRRLAPRWQLLVTTAHPSWAKGLAEFARSFEVRQGHICHT